MTKFNRSANQMSRVFLAFMFVTIHPPQILLLYSNLCLSFSKIHSLDCYLFQKPHSDNPLICLEALLFKILLCFFPYTLLKKKSYWVKNNATTTFSSSPLLTLTYKLVSQASLQYDSVHLLKHFNSFYFLK